MTKNRITILEWHSETSFSYIDHSDKKTYIVKGVSPTRSELAQQMWDQRMKDLTDTPGIEITEYQVEVLDD